MGAADASCEPERGRPRHVQDLYTNQSWTLIIQGKKNKNNTSPAWSGPERSQGFNQRLMHGALITLSLACLWSIHEVTAFISFCFSLTETIHKGAKNHTGHCHQCQMRMRLHTRLFSCERLTVHLKFVTERVGVEQERALGGQQAIIWPWSFL